jgi:hypothetical protein
MPPVSALGCSLDPGALAVLRLGVLLAPAHGNETP